MARHLSGSYNTHVANGTIFQIFAKVDENEQQIKSTHTKIENELGIKVKTGKVDVEGSNKFKYENKTEYFEKKLRETCGFTTIGPGQFMNFPSNNPHVSVFYKKGNGLGDVVCNTMKVAPDNSIIVTPTGIVASIYGDIWLDASGKRWGS